MSTETKTPPETCQHCGAEKVYSCTEHSVCKCSHAEAYRVQGHHEAMRELAQLRAELSAMKAKGIHDTRLLEDQLSALQTVAADAQKRTDAMERLLSIGTPVLNEDGRRKGLLEIVIERDEALAREAVLEKRLEIKEKIVEHYTKECYAGAAREVVLEAALEDISCQSQNYQNRGDERDHATFHEVIRVANTALDSTGGELLDAVREAVDALKLVHPCPYCGAQRGHDVGCRIGAALAKLRPFAGGKESA